MNELTGEEIVKRIVSDKGALKDLIYHIVSDPEMRVAVISAVLSEVATKQDVRDLRQEMNQLRQEMNQLRTEIDGLRREINDLRREMRSLIRWTITAILIVWGSTVLPVMMRLAGII
jgi:chromosome segregation ATPase